MDSTRIKGIFIGYSLSSKAYRIYIKEGRHIELSRDVIFDENKAYNKSKYIPIDYDDEVRALLFLCLLPKSWNGLVMVVSNFVSGSSTLKFDDVVNVILSEEM